jgi:RNA polymerase sigma-70 factor (ECF subfamily)
MLNPKANAFDAEALEHLFKEYFIPLCGWCQYKFELEQHLAKEVVHRSFIRLWENRASLSAELPAKSYLYKIVTNMTLNMLRDEKVKQKNLHLVADGISRFTEDEVGSRCELKQLAIEIDRAVAELPAQMRRIFLLSRHDGLTYAEIATLLNISVKTVETQISRARIKLKEKLSLYLPAILCAVLLAR